MTTTTVIFGGVPINVSISTPTPGLNSTSNEGPPIVPTTNTPLANPGNGIDPLTQGQNPVDVVALETLQAFVAVVMGVGGVVLADISNPAHRSLVWGINTKPVIAGQLASVVWGGPVSNTINGTGGWNFVLNQPVYIITGGAISQTPPSVGWVLPIGFAISQNSIQFFPSSESASALLDGAPVVSALTFSPNVVANFNLADVYDLTLTGNTVLSMSSGTDGRIVTFRLRQDATGGRSLTLDTDVITGSTFVDLPGAANASAIYQFQYQGNTDKYVCISANTF